MSISQTPKPQHIMIANIFGSKSRTEAILILIITIGVLTIDDAPSKIDTNLEKLRNFDFGDEMRKRNMEILLKTTLAIIMLVKSYTSRIFWVLSAALLWSVVLGKKQYLMVPWLTLGFIRSVLLTFLSLIIGVYICLVQRGYNAICLEFLLAQTITHGPSVYGWVSLYSYYQSLRASIKVSRTNKANCSYFAGTNYQPKEDDQNFITESNITNLIINLKKLKPWDVPTRSLDSLLSLPTSKIKDKNSENSISDFVKKTLSLADEDIAKAKLEKSCRNLPKLSSDMELAKSVSFSGRRKFKKPKEATRTKSSVEFVDKEVELKCVSLEHVHSRKDKDINDNAFRGNEQSNVEKCGAENDFGCQVSTLGRIFLNQSPTEVTERFSLVKTDEFEEYSL